MITATSSQRIWSKTTSFIMFYTDMWSMSTEILFFVGNSENKLCTGGIHILILAAARERERIRFLDKARRVNTQSKKCTFRDLPRGAISCSLLVREHIYFQLISNALVNFLPLFIAGTCDLS